MSESGSKSLKRFLRSPKKSGQKSKKKRLSNDAVQLLENPLESTSASDSSDESSTTHGHSDVEPVLEFDDLSDKASIGDEINLKKLEEDLEKFASRHNLTARNVKSLLRHILHDESFVAYVDPAAGVSSTSDQLWNALPGAATKLTRSKARMRAAPDLATPKKNSILDISFSDDSETDDEYVPTDDDASQESDHSCVTSANSFTLSPMERAVSEPYTEEVLQSSDDAIFKVPYAPTIQEASDIIAKRTRSRLPMPNVEVEELEMSFVPPDLPSDCFEELSGVGDIDPDDLIWKSWLADLMKPTRYLNDSIDDPNDEDFNYMADDLDDLDVDEFRDDKAVRVTQKELKELFSELLLGYGASDEDDLNCGPQLEAETIEPVLQSTPSKTDDLIATPLELTLAQRQQICAQMQQHMQLLTQMYMMTCLEPTLRNEALACKSFIDELGRLSNVADKRYAPGLKEFSVFCCPGLMEAKRIVDSLPSRLFVDRPSAPQATVCRSITVKGVTQMTKEYWQQPPMNLSVATVLATERYFATYTEILPDQVMDHVESTKPRSKDQLLKARVRKVKFTKGEDNLLIMGLERFGRKYKLISENLLPGRSPDLIRRRVSLKLRNSKANLVKCVLQQGHLPPSALTFTLNITKPRELSPYALVELPNSFWKNHCRKPYWYLKREQDIKEVMRKATEEKQYQEYIRNHGLKDIAPGPSTKVVPQANGRATTPTMIGPSAETDRARDHAQHAEANLPVPASKSSTSSVMPSVSLVPLAGKPVRVSSSECPSDASVTGSSLNHSELQLSSAISKSLDAVSHVCVVQPSCTRTIVCSADVPVSTSVCRGMTLSSLQAPISTSAADRAALPVGSIPTCRLTPSATAPDVGNASLFPDAGACADECTFSSKTVPCSEGSEPSRTGTLPADSRQLGDSTHELEVGACATSAGDSSNAKRPPRKKEKKMEVVAFDYHDNLKEKLEDMAETYFILVKETLSSKPSLFLQFWQVMKESEKAGWSSLQIYNKLSDIFKDYPLLLDEFVRFLEEDEARQVGKFVKWQEFDNVIKFILRCQKFFHKTPSLIPKVFECLANLIEREDDQQKILDEVSVIFRGDKELIREFAVIFHVLPPSPCKDEEIAKFEHPPISSGVAVSKEESKVVTEFEEVVCPPTKRSARNAKRKKEADHVEPRRRPPTRMRLRSKRGPKSTGAVIVGNDDCAEHAKNAGDDISTPGGKDFCASHAEHDDTLSNNGSDGNSNPRVDDLGLDAKRITASCSLVDKGGVNEDMSSPSDVLAGSSRSHQCEIGSPEKQMPPLPSVQMCSVKELCGSPKDGVAAIASWTAASDIEVLSALGVPSTADGVGALMEIPDSEVKVGLVKTESDVSFEQKLLLCYSEEHNETALEWNSVAGISSHSNQPHSTSSVSTAPDCSVTQSAPGKALRTGAHEENVAPSGNVNAEVASSGSELISGSARLVRASDVIADSSCSSSPNVPFGLPRFSHGVDFTIAPTVCRKPKGHDTVNVESNSSANVIKRSKELARKLAPLASKGKTIHVRPGRPCQFPDNELLQVPQTEAHNLPARRRKLDPRASRAKTIAGRPCKFPDDELLRVPQMETHNLPASKVLDRKLAPPASKGKSIPARPGRTCKFPDDEFLRGPQTETFPPVAPSKEVPGSTHLDSPSSVKPASVCSLIVMTSSEAPQCDAVTLSRTFPLISSGSTAASCVASSGIKLDATPASRLHFVPQSDETPDARDVTCLMSVAPATLSSRIAAQESALSRSESEQGLCDLPIPEAEELSFNEITLLNSDSIGPLESLTLCLAASTSAVASTTMRFIERSSPISKTESKLHRTAPDVEGGARLHLEGKMAVYPDSLIAGGSGCIDIRNSRSGESLRADLNLLSVSVAKVTPSRPVASSGVDLQLVHVNNVSRGSPGVHSFGAVHTDIKQPSSTPSPSASSLQDGASAGSWTRNDDRVILLALKQARGSLSADLLCDLASQVHRSEDEVRSRWKFLLGLVAAMSKPTDKKDESGDTSASETDASSSTVCNESDGSDDARGSDSEDSGDTSSSELEGNGNTSASESEGSCNRNAIASISTVDTSAGESESSGDTSVSESEESAETSSSESEGSGDTSASETESDGDGWSPHAML